MATSLSEIDRANLMKAAEQNPRKAIKFESGFLDGTNKKPFGLIPNDWDGETVYYSYKKAK